MDKYRFNRSLAILTWRSPCTLAQTLGALGSVSHLFDEKLVVCQEGDLEEIRLAKHFDYKPVKTEANLGIQGGLKYAVEQTNNKRVLLLENDCHFLGETDAFERLLEEADHLMNSSAIRFTKMHPHTNQNGKRFFKYWSVCDRKIKRRPLGYIRANKANLLLSKGISLVEPAVLPSEAVAEVGGRLFLTNSRYCTWANRANYLDRDFFLNELVTFAEENPTRRTHNNSADLEHSINSPWRRRWWRRQRFPILDVYPNFFGHLRLDRPEGDIKRINGSINWMPERLPVDWRHPS